MTTAHTDALKLYTRAHGAKTTNLIINLDHPEWVYDTAPGGPTLAELGIGRWWPNAENETELSLFHREAYEAFLQNPATRWDENA